MKISPETLEKIARLARLEIPESERPQLTADLEKVLTWMEKLNEVDTDQVEPLIHMTDRVNNFRADIAKGALDKKKALDLAPESDDDYFRVPRVMK